MALESLFLKLETFPAPLWNPETHTQLLRPSQSQLEVVIYSRNFQKTTPEPEKSDFFCTKSGLEPKLLVRFVSNFRFRCPYVLVKKCHPGDQNPMTSPIGGFFKNWPPLQKSHFWHFEPKNDLRLSGSTWFPPFLTIIHGF